MERQDAVGKSVVMLPNVMLSQNDIIQSSTILEWHKLPQETSDDFTRFECYRTVQGKRSVGKAYQAYIVLKHGRAELDRRKAGGKWALTGYPVQWARMAKRNRWAERAAAFDAHQHELDMQVEIAERDRCRQLRKDALNKLLTASTNALKEIDLSEVNLAQASTAIKTAVRELRTEYHDDTQPVEVNAMLAIIPNELRQGILAMLQVKTGPTALSPGPDNEDNIIDNDDTY